MELERLAQQLRVFNAFPGLKFGSQHPLTGSQPSVTPTPEDPTPFGLCGHCTQVHKCPTSCHRHTHFFKRFTEERKKEQISTF